VGERVAGSLADRQRGNPLKHFVALGCPKCSFDKTGSGLLRTIRACLLGETIFEETIDKQILMDLKELKGV